MAGLALSTVYVKVQALVDKAQFRRATDAAIGGAGFGKTGEKEGSAFGTSFSRTASSAISAARLKAEVPITANDAKAVTNIDKIKGRLAELSRQVAEAKLTADDKDAVAKLAGFQVRLDAVDRKTAKANISVEGTNRALADLAAVDAGLGRLNRKSGDTGSAFGRMSDSIASAGRGMGIFQTAALFLPALIPAAAGATAAVGGIAASFGAAGAAAIGFGKLAQTVLTSANTDATALQTLQDQNAKASTALQASQGAALASLQQRLREATTAAQRKSIGQQITDLKKQQATQTQTLTDAQAQQQAVLEKGWSTSYKQLVTTMGNISDQWKTTSRNMASPVLVPWLDAVSKAMKFLKPLLQPVADVFKSWGQSLDRYFGSAKGSAEISRIATAFGKFSASQLQILGTSIVLFGRGIAALISDLAGHNIDFGNFGNHLLVWAQAFEQWSRSKAARADVAKLLQFFRDNGATITAFLKSVGQLLPGAFAGLTSAGQLELKVITDFLGVILSLPKSWIAPLTEGLIGVGIALKAWPLITALLKGGKWLFGMNVTGSAAAAAEMRTGIISGGSVAAGELRAAMTGGAVAGGAAKGAAGGAAEGAAAGGFAAGLRKLLPAGITLMAAGLVTELLVKPVFKDVKLPDWLGGSGNKRSLWDGPKDLSSWSGFFGMLGRAFAGIGVAWSTLWSVSYEGFQRGFAGKLTSWFTVSLPHLFTVSIPNASRTLVRAGSDMVGGFAGGAQSAIGGILRWFAGIPGRVVRTFTSPGTLLRNTGIQILNGLSGGLLGSITGFIRMVSGLVTRIIGAFESLLGIKSPSSVAAGWGRDIIQGLLNGVTGWWPNFWRWFTGIPGWISGVFRGAPTLLRNAGGQILRGLFNGAAGNWAGGTSRWFASIPGWVLGFFRGAGTLLMSSGRAILQGLWNGAVNVWGGTSRWVASLPGAIRGYFRGAGTLLWNAGYSIIQGLGNGLFNAARGVGNWMRQIGGWIVNAVKGFFGIRSPSSVMAGYGSNILLGLLHGMLSTAGQIPHFLGKIFGGMPGALGAVVHKGLISLTSLPAKALSALSGLGGTIGSWFAGLFGGGGAAGQAGGGVQRWRGTVLQALAMEGLPASLVNNVLYQMQTESGGNPGAINLVDSNAAMGDPSRGLMQTIMSTFLRWHWPGTSYNIYDPLANIAAAINYSRHGRGFGSGAGQMGSGHGYALGGVITEPIWGIGRSGQRYTFGERGPETVTPGTGGTRTYHIDVRVAPGGSPADTGREVVHAIQAYESANGKRWRT
jgi:SLT domain-containing protein